MTTLITLYFIIGFFVTAFCAWVRFGGDRDAIYETQNVMILIILFFTWGWIVPKALYDFFATRRED